VGEEGLKLFEKVIRAKLDAEERKLKIRGEASMKALLSTLTGEQAERLLKLAELEMRKGATEEQAFALIFQKTTDIPPALLDALKSRVSEEGRSAESAKELPET
jgi:hypothetical protein